MYKGDYKGDSPGKKVSRLRTWMQMRQVHRILNLPYHGALVLGGHGGDIETLKGLNFEHESITAIDLDPFLTEWCAHEHPNINAICGEAGDASRNVRYNMAHLDFCGGLSVDNIRTVSDIVGNTWTMPTVLAVTMLKGREYLGGATQSLLGDISRSTRREMYKIAQKRDSPIGKALFKGLRCDCDNSPKGQKLEAGVKCGSCGSKLGYFDPYKMVNLAEELQRDRLNRGVGPGSEGGGLFANDDFSIVEKAATPDAFIERGYLKKNGSLGPVGQAIARANALQYIIDWLSWAKTLHASKLVGRRAASLEPVGLRLLGTLGYHSREKGQKKGGTPFMTAFYLVRLKRQDAGIVGSMLQHFEMERAVVGAKSTPLIFHHSMDIKASVSSLEPTAAELAKVLPNKTVAKMLAVDPRSIPAWKAHHSRGSYPVGPVVQMQEGVKGFQPFKRCDPENPEGVMGETSALGYRGSTPSPTNQPFKTLVRGPLELL